MIKYTVGFIFDPHFEYVLLMHKTKPAFQAGKVNGLGGKLEPGEDMFECTVREIKEESGLVTDKDKWVHTGTMYSDTFNLEVLGYVYEGNRDDAKTIEAEEIEWFKVSDLPENTLPNVRWMVPMVIDKMKNQDFESFKVKYYK